MAAMTKEELAEYNKLLKQATGFFRRDIEGKFRFAAALREMVRLSGDARIVSRDLGMSGAAEVEKYIRIVNFWEDERIPDFPGQPARWAHYRDVLFSSDFDKAGRLNQAYLAAMRGGISEIDRVRRRFQAEDREEWKNSEEAQKLVKASREGRTDRWVGNLIDTLNLAATVSDCDDFERPISPEESEAIRIAFEEVARNLAAIGVISVLKGRAA